MPHGRVVVCRDPIDFTGTAQFGLLLQDVSGYLRSPGAPLRNRHSSPRSPLVLLLQGKPCPRECPLVWNLCLLSFVFIVIISGRRLLLLISGMRLLLLIFYSLFELLTLRTLTRQQLCLFLRRFLSRWLCSWSLLRLLCLLVGERISARFFARRPDTTGCESLPRTPALVVNAFLSVASGECNVEPPWLRLTHVGIDFTFLRPSSWFSSAPRNVSALTGFVRRSLSRLPAFTVVSIPRLGS